MDSMLQLARSGALQGSPPPESDPILPDLINALLCENLFGLLDRAETLPQAERMTLAAIELQGQEQLWRAWLVPNKHYLLWRMVPAWLGPFQISRAPVWSVRLFRSGPRMRSLSAPAVLLMLTRAFPDQEFLPNLAGVVQALRIAIAQSAFSADHVPAEITALEFPSWLSLERLSAWRDRPFHPTARAKVGWSGKDYRRFSPELSSGFSVSWIAVRRDHLQMSSAASRASLAAAVLCERDQSRLNQVMSAAGLCSADYLALPVHPWQAQRVLPERFTAEIETRICVPLPFVTGNYFPTASLRSLAPMGGQGTHLKLPLGIDSLGALRILPLRYLANGEKGQRLLQQVMTRQDWLRRRVYLADETRWWAFHTPELTSNSDEFADQPGHLACLLRQYPRILGADEQRQLVPIAALAVKPWSRQVWSQWLSLRREADSGPSVLALFAEISAELISTALAFARDGVMPELHGQNVVLVLREGQIAGLLLRDHDTVRLYRPWMQAAGIADPGYQVKPGTPNTLILNQPEILLSYFLTLVVQVNLAAIIDAVSVLYEIEAKQLWRVLRQSLRRGIQQTEWTANQQDTVHHFIWKTPTWPFKQILRPLLSRQGSGGGSMPSSLGTIQNPFYYLEE